MTPTLKVIMFTDRVKSVLGKEKQTYLEIEQVARQQDALTVEVLSLTGGRFLKGTGDGCLAEFQSVLAAVQAGRLLQQRISERNVAQNKANQFKLHIGIDVGELIAVANDLQGHAADRCARICSKCPPGEIYLSAEAARMLNRNEVQLSSVGPFLLRGIKGKLSLFRVEALHVQPRGAPNPFVWRGGITSADDFFNRDNEQRILRDYLHQRQNCQVVGPRRIGKTSLLRQIERLAPTWEEGIVVTYLDLQDARCFKLRSWLDFVSRKFGWPTPASTLADFAERVEEMLSKKQRPVLCLDEFEELTSRNNEFGRDFFLNLRSCGQQGMSIFTGSRKQLSRLTEPSDPTSPFYNTFPLMNLGLFSGADAHDFVTIQRAGVPAFTPDERSEILGFAEGRPLALQVACFHLLEAKQNGESLSAAMRKAGDDLRANLALG